MPLVFILVFFEFKNRRPIREQTGVGGCRREHRREQHAETTHAKDGFTELTKRALVHRGEVRDDVVVGDFLAGPMERCRSEQIKGDGCTSVDCARHPRIPAHHVQPAQCAVEPADCVVVFAGVSGVALFDAPVRVVNQFRRANADDGECAESNGKILRQRERQAAANVARRDCEVLGELKRDQRKDGKKCKQHHHRDTDPLDQTISAGEQHPHAGQRDDGDKSGVPAGCFVHYQAGDASHHPGYLHR